MNSEEEKCTQKNFNMTKNGLGIFYDFGGVVKNNLTVPQFPIPGYFAKLCSGSCKNVLIFSAVPKGDLSN